MKILLIIGLFGFLGTSPLFAEGDDVKTLTAKQKQNQAAHAKAHGKYVKLGDQIRSELKSGNTPSQELVQKRLKAGAKADNLKAEGLKLDSAIKMEEHKVAAGKHIRLKNAQGSEVITHADGQKVRKVYQESPGAKSARVERSAANAAMHEAFHAEKAHEQKVKQFNEGLKEFSKSSTRDSGKRGSIRKK